jgi:hypothetical protein
VRLDRRRGRTLAVIISAGECSEPSTTRVVQTRSVVVVGYLPGDPTGDVCPAVLRDVRVVITLDAAIGDRPVIDARGRPILPPLGSASP